MDQTYWEAYKNISSKLKKRFLRRPKYDEAEEEYTSLANELKKEGAHQPAALCFLAVARCQEAMGNLTDMARNTHEAGRLHISAVHYDLYSAYLPLADCIADATNTYLLAVSMYIDIRKPSLASAVLLELAGILYDMRLFEESMLYYKKAYSLQQHTPLAALGTLRRVADCLIVLGNIDVAVNTFTELIDLATESATMLSRLGQLQGSASTPMNGDTVYWNAILDAEISRMLLLTLMQPTPSNPEREYVEMLYAYEAEDPPIKSMNLEMYSVLQDVWTARSIGDVEALLELQGELSRRLTRQQNNIVQMILDAVCHE
eukprot:CFRG5749T1